MGTTGSAPSNKALSVTSSKTTTYTATLADFAAIRRLPSLRAPFTLTLPINTRPARGGDLHSRAQLWHWRGDDCAQRAKLERWHSQLCSANTPVPRIPARPLCRE